MNNYNYIAVTGCLLRNGISMEKVTKAFSYSFNVLHVSHAWKEVLERFMIELLELNTLNESTFRINFYCVKSTFLFETTIIDKILKVMKEPLNHFNVTKHLKF